METLIYKIHKNDENGHSELLSKGTEREVRKVWKKLSAESGYDYDLSCGWEINGRSLGTTLIETK